MKRKLMTVLALCAVLCFAVVNTFAGEYLGTGKSGGNKSDESRYYASDDDDDDDDGEYVEIESEPDSYDYGGNNYYASYIDWNSGNYVRSGNLIYEIDAGSGYAAVFSCNPNATEAVIAGNVKGYPVDRIQACAFQGCTRLRSISFPESVEIIAAAAFRGCTSLTSVNLPEKLTVLFSSAFENCTALSKVTPHAKLAVIGDFAFSGCVSLSSLKVPNCVTKIFDNALPDTTAVVCKQGSYAESWAIKKNHAYRYTGNVVVTAIKLNSEKKTLKITSRETPTYQLTAEIQPAETAGTTLTWRSSDKSVAKVDKNGLVTAIAPGKATITCKADDEGGASATCAITVKAATVEFFRVVKESNQQDVTEGTVSVKVDSRTQLQIVDLQPANAVNTDVTWKSSDKSVCQVTSKGVLKGIAPGKATITVTSADGNFKVTFKVKVK